MIPDKHEEINKMEINDRGENENFIDDFFYKLDRSYFMDNEFKSCAGVDSALPIGCGQTISQPSLVLQMTKLLKPAGDKAVLEIGTGSGYQTALLAKFSKEVFTIERVRELADKAKVRLDALGYCNISFKTGDGSDGWVEKSPFDRIIVTAAAGKMPQDLLDQLAPCGRMIVPVGPPEVQELILVIKDCNGRIRESPIEMVRFVEMKGKYGWYR